MRSRDRSGDQHEVGSGAGVVPYATVPIQPAHAGLLGVRPHAPSAPDLLLVGGEDHALRIPFLLALRAQGFRVAAAGTGDPAPFARAGLDYAAFHFDRFLGPWADWTAVAALARLFADVRPGLVQCFDTKPNLLVPFAARRLPDLLVVRTVNGLGWLYSSASPLALALRPAFCALHRVAARSAAVTVFQNREDQAYFKRHRMDGGRPSHLIPGSGVDIEGFDRRVAAGPSPARLRQELGLGAAKVVVTVARMTRQKGIPTLLDAAARVHAVRPGVRFVLVGPREGEGPFAVADAEIAAHRPYVVAAGKRADVPSLLAMADVFAFPTEYREGVPRALLEAALAGLPLVATRMPGCTDVIRDGESGYLVPPRSPGALADRILTMLGDRAAARAMGGRAAALVRREFGLELTAIRYAGLYRALLRPGAKAGAEQRVGPGCAPPECVSCEDFDMAQPPHGWAGPC